VRFTWSQEDQVVAGQACGSLAGSYKRSGVDDHVPSGSRNNSAGTVTYAGIRKRFDAETA